MFVSATSWSTGLVSMPDTTRPADEREVKLRLYPPPWKQTTMQDIIYVTQIQTGLAFEDRCNPFRGGAGSRKLTASAEPCDGLLVKTP